MKNLHRYPVGLSNDPLALPKQKNHFLTSHTICLQIDINFQNLNQNGLNNLTTARQTL